MTDRVRVAAAVAFVAACGGAGSAAVGAASGGLGASILNQVSSDRISLPAACGYAALGGALTGPIQALLLPRATSLDLTKQVVTSAVLASAHGAIGAVLLHAREVPWTYARKSATAAAVGSALLLMCAAAVFGASLCCDRRQTTTQEPTAESPGSLESA